MSLLYQELLEIVLDFVFDRQQPLWCHQDRATVLSVRRVCRQWERAASGEHTWAVIERLEDLSRVLPPVSECILHLLYDMQHQYHPESFLAAAAHAGGMWDTVEHLRLGLVVWNTDVLDGLCDALAQALLLPDGRRLRSPRLRSLHLFVHTVLSDASLERYVERLFGPLVRAALDAQLPDVLVDLDGRMSTHLRQPVTASRWWGAAGAAGGSGTRTRLGWIYSLRNGMATPAVAALRQDILRAATSGRPWSVLSLPAADISVLDQMRAALPDTLDHLEMTEGGHTGQPSVWRAVLPVAPRRTLRLESRVHNGTWSVALRLPALAAVPEWDVFGCSIHNERDVHDLGVVCDMRRRQQQQQLSTSSWTLSIFWNQATAQAPPTSTTTMDLPRIRCRHLHLLVYGAGPAAHTNWGRWLANTFDIHGELTWSSVLPPDTVGVAFLRAWRPASVATRTLDLMLSLLDAEAPWPTACSGCPVLHAAADTFPGLTTLRCRLCRPFSWSGRLGHLWTAALGRWPGLTRLHFDLTTTLLQGGGLECDAITQQEHWMAWFRGMMAAVRANTATICTVSADLPLQLSPDRRNEADTLLMRADASS